MHVHHETVRTGGLQAHNHMIQKSMPCQWCQSLRNVIRDRLQPRPEPGGKNHRFHASERLFDILLPVHHGHPDVETAHEMCSKMFGAIH